MSVTRIATRYAKSLIELAVEQGKLEQVHSDMNRLAEAMKNRDFYLFLKSPIINEDKKNAALEAIAKGRVDQLTLSFVKLLIKKNRENYVPEIVAEFMEQYKKLKNITSVKVTAAAPMSEGVLAGVRKKLHEGGMISENLEVETHVDPELIGGFILEFDNKRYDASISRKLEELKISFSKNPYVREA